MCRVCPEARSFCTARHDRPDARICTLICDTGHMLEQVSVIRGYQERQVHLWSSCVGFVCRPFSTCLHRHSRLARAPRSTTYLGGRDKAAVSVGAR